MRARDLLPVVLLGGIAAVIVAQVLTMDPPPREQADVSSPASPSSAKTRNAPRPNVAAITTDSAEEGQTADSAGVTDNDIAVTRLPPLAPPQLRDLNTIQMLIRDGAPGTYLLDILAEQNDLLVRWPDRRGDAIRVWIDRNPDVPDWDSDYAVVAEHAFEEWQRAGFPLRFLIMRDSANTEVKIRWVDTFPAEVGPKLGMTRKLRDQHGWIRSADITVATQDPSGRRLPPDVVAGTARHEVGHALGLGHSPSATDVMYHESRVTAISTADRATLRLLYILPPGPVK